MSLFGLALSATLVAQGFPSAPDRSFETLRSPDGTYTAELSGHSETCSSDLFCDAEARLSVRSGERNVVSAQSVWSGDGFHGGFAREFPYRHWRNEHTLVLSPWPGNQVQSEVRFLVHNGSGNTVDYLRLSASQTFVSLDLDVDEVRRIDDAPLRHGQPIIIDAVVGGRHLPGHAIELAPNPGTRPRTVCVFVGERRLRVRDAGTDGDCAPSGVLRATAPLNFIAR